jgi:hypothetical protein
VTIARGTAFKDMDVSAKIVGVAQIALMPALSGYQIVNRIYGIEWILHHSIPVRLEVHRRRQRGLLVLGKFGHQGFGGYQQACN